jgi:DNA-binding ferritin-like protein
MGCTPVGRLCDANLGLTDLIAERVRSLCDKTLTLIGAIGAKTTIKNEDDTSLNAMTMVKDFSRTTRPLSRR